MKYLKRIVLLIIISLISNIVFCQQNKEANTKERYSAYELLSSYYNNTDFKPFKKSNIYFGMSFSLTEQNLENVDYLLEEVIEGEKNNYSIDLQGGYYIGNYVMLGANFNFYQKKFVGDIFQDPDTMQSNSIMRGFYITPYIRTSFPLVENERLSFFTEIGLTYGRSNSLSRKIKALDDVEKSFSTNNIFKAGISPGITFFAMENFAFEVQLDVLGYTLDVIEKTQNGEKQSMQVKQNIDFKIDILSLNLGLSYYIGAKNK